MPFVAMSGQSKAASFSAFESQTERWWLHYNDQHSKHNDTTKALVDLFCQPQVFMISLWAQSDLLMWCTLVCSDD